MNRFLRKIRDGVQKECMKVMAGLLATLFMATPASSQDVGRQKITVTFQQQTLADCLNKINAQTNIRFYYEGNELKQITQKHTANFIDQPLSLVLKTLLEGTGFSWQEVNRNIVIKKIDTKENKTANEIVTRTEQGKVTGKIVDEGSGRPVAGATVRIGSKGVITDMDGSFSISLSKGNYTATVSYVGYGMKEVSEIIVRDNETYPLNITLKRVKGQLEGVVVKASARKEGINALYARQKRNAAMSDGISAEQIARTPDNNAAQVLKRVSGLQVSDDKYVVIRGLSDRYNNVLLNGVTLPSSEPNKRNFAFDIVPSSLLEEIVVNKTATPDLTGEFAGGLVQIRTKSIPDNNFLQLSVGTGFNTQSTGKEMIGLDRGKNAWTGFASDIHKKPQGMTFGQYNALEAGIGFTTPADDPARQQIHAFLRTMPENWRLKKYTAMPVQSYQVQLGRVMHFRKENRLGLLAALSYRNDQDIEKREMHGIYSHDFKGTNNKYATTLGGSFNLSYQSQKHKFTFQNTYNRKFSDALWKYTGVDGDNANVLHDSYNNLTVINQLFQTQIGGEHTIGKHNIKADWFGSAGRTDRDQPYSRVMARFNGFVGDDYPKDYFRYDLQDNSLKNGSLFYSGLKEKIYNWGANVQVPFRLLEGEQLFKTGYAGKYRSAGFNADLYRMRAFSMERYQQGVPYDQVFTAGNFGTDLYLHSVNSRGGDRDNGVTEGYDGFQRLNALYAMLDLRLLKRLRLIGGMRAEINDQNVSNYNCINGNYVPELTNLSQTDWLPSVNAIYSITDKINVRGAWYKTVARPDLRELSSFTYWDYDFFASIQGAKLQTTSIENADVRFEYYPAPGEIISISAFYKNFKNPIELLYFQSSGSTMVYLYNNLESSLDKGLEFDFRKSFGFIAPSSGFLSRLYLSGNFTWLDASVRFTAYDAVDESGNPVPAKRDRPLAGQSPYIINGGLLYAGESLGVNLTYNRYGKRIVFASPDRTSDEYERPRDLLDLQVSYRFLKQKRAELKLNISDLLNQEQIFYKNHFDMDNPFGFDPGWPSIERYPGVGSGMLPEHIDPKGTSYNKDYDTAVRKYRFGTSFSFNFSYRF